MTYIVQKHSPVSLELKKSLNTREGELCVDNGFLQIIFSDHLSLFCHKKKSYEYTEAYDCPNQPKAAQTFLFLFIIDQNSGDECR